MVTRSIGVVAAFLLVLGPAATASATDTGADEARNGEADGEAPDDAPGGADQAPESGGAEPAEPPVDPVDVASRANDVNQEYCVDAYARDVSLASESTATVAQAWGEVDGAYRATGASYLLFWRGVLEQCLGRNDAAGEDLQAFVDAQAATGGMDDLVAQAEARLRRLGYARPWALGPSARYLQRAQVLVLGASYQGGIAVPLQTCFDDEDGYINSACPQHPPDGTARHPRALTGQPAGLTATLALFPARFLGVGASWSLQEIAPERIGVNDTDTNEEGQQVQPVFPYELAMGPVWTLMAGPVIRIQRSEASGSKGARVQVMPAVVARHERFTPLAGNLPDSSAEVFLYAGSWGWTAAGFGGTLEVTRETRSRSGVRLAVAGGYCPPRAQPRMTEVEPPSDEVQTWNDPLSLTAGFVDLSLGALLFPGAAEMAIVPAFHLGWSNVAVQYSDGDNTWTEPNPGGEDLTRKVYDTRQDRFMILFDIGIRLGLGDLSG